MADQDFNLMAGDNRAGRQPKERLLKKPEPRPRTARTGSAGTTAGTEVTPQNDSFVVNFRNFMHSEPGALELGKGLVTKSLDLGGVRTNDTDVVTVRNEHRTKPYRRKGPVARSNPGVLDPGAPDEVEVGALHEEKSPRPPHRENA